jgi:hypothetical protein
MEVADLFESKLIALGDIITVAEFLGREAFANVLIFTGIRRRPLAGCALCTACRMSST